MSYFFSTLLGAAIFAVPFLIGWFLSSDWNERRAARARNYRHRRAS